MNTLFTRTVLLSVTMLLAVHIGYRLIASVSLTGDDDFPGSALPSAATYTPYAPPDDASRDSADIAGIGPALSIRPQIVDLRAPLAPSLRAAVWLPAAPMSTNAFVLADADEPSVWGDPPFLAAFDTPFAPLVLYCPPPSSRCARTGSVRRGAAYANSRRWRAMPVAAARRCAYPDAGAACATSAGSRAP